MSFGHFKNKVIHKIYAYNIYIYIYIYFIIQRVKARAMPCPRQGDNTVSVAQGGTATPAPDATNHRTGC